MGHSVAWMEGDELVIETSNFVADKWGIHTGVDSSDQKTSGRKNFARKMRVLALKIQMTITDPKYLSEPTTIDYYMAKNHGTAILFQKTARWKTPGCFLKRVKIAN